MFVGRLTNECHQGPHSVDQQRQEEDRRLFRIGSLLYLTDLEELSGQTGAVEGMRPTVEKKLAICRRNHSCDFWPYSVLRKCVQ